MVLDKIIMDALREDAALGDITTDNTVAADAIEGFLHSKSRV